MVISIGFIWNLIFSDWGQNLTHKNPLGIILEKRVTSAKPFWGLLKIYRFYLDPHFSAWDQKGLEPDHQFSLWAHIGFITCPIGCPIL